MTRPTWSQVYIEVAHVIAKRATCDRRHVGAVIVQGNKVVATGFNGAVRGQAHCDDVGHQMVEIGGRPSCVRTVHAEANALLQAGRDADGATIYATDFPCLECSKLIVNAGVAKVIYDRYYESRSTDLSKEMLNQAGIPVLAISDLT